MTDNVPAAPRLDREALERVIRRAAELQAGEREIGENLTESELLQLGRDVGIPEAFLRQALQEERTRTLAAAEGGPLVRYMGRRFVAAERTVQGSRRDLERALRHWLTEGELLQVKRRYPDRTTWEPRHGTIASLKRSLGIGGRRYELAQAREIVARVAPVDQHRCHVQLVGDYSNTFREHLTTAALVAGAGGVATGIGLVLGVMGPVAAVPAAVLVPVSLLIARSRRRKVERFQVGLDQVLDRLEHGEIPLRPEIREPRPSAFTRIADEIKKNFMS